MSLQMKKKILTSFEQNARVLYCSETMEGVFLDPASRAEELLEMAKKLNVTIKGIWLTHAHPDHCGAVAGLKRLTGAPFYAHAEGRSWRANTVQFMKMSGCDTAGMENCPEPDVYVAHGDKLKFGNLEFQALHTPGHAPDHLCFYCEGEKCVFTGDTLFAGSVGRTDLPGGNRAELSKSIKEVIMALPPETKVYTGHGPDTVIEKEIKTNPYLQF